MLICFKGVRYPARIFNNKQNTASPAPRPPNRHPVLARVVSTSEPKLVTIRIQGTGGRKPSRVTPEGGGGIFEPYGSCPAVKIHTSRFGFLLPSTRSITSHTAPPACPRASRPKPGADASTTATPATSATPPPDPPLRLLGRAQVVIPTAAAAIVAVVVVPAAVAATSVIPPAAPAPSGGRHMVVVVVRVGIAAVVLTVVPLVGALVDADRL